MIDPPGPHHEWALRPPKTAELLARRLRDWIVSGELPEGHHLPPERDLMEQYGASRGAVRDAMLLLETQGLVIVRRGARGGATITNRTAELVKTATLLSLQTSRVTLGDLYETLASIEPAAARLCAQTRPHEASQALLAQIEDHRAQLADPLGAALAMQRFHQTMMENSASPTLIIVTAPIYSIMRDQIRWLHEVAARQPSRRFPAVDKARALAVHAELADLIAQGDPDRVEARWRAYSARLRDRFFRIVARNTRIRRDDLVAAGLG